MSEISGIANLQAAINAYNNVSTKSAPTTPTEAVQFQDMVKVQFNKFSGMNPSQILNHITEARSSRPSITDSVQLSHAAEHFGNTLRKHEDVTRKSIVGKASLQEVMTAANEASNAVKTATAVRGKLLDAWDKIMNMQI